MSVFVQSAVLWTFALYGLFEIIKTMLYIHTYNKCAKHNLTKIIIATKDQEQNIEGILRSMLSRIFFEKDILVDKIILTDLNSRDNTKEILKKLSEDYECVNYIETFDLINLLNEETH